LGCGRKTIPFHFTVSLHQFYLPPPNKEMLRCSKYLVKYLHYFEFLWKSSTTRWKSSTVSRLRNTGLKDKNYNESGQPSTLGTFSIHFILFSELCTLIRTFDESICNSMFWHIMRVVFATSTLLKTKLNDFETFVNHNDHFWDIK